jgi:hypothetical protein
MNINIAKITLTHFNTIYRKKFLIDASGYPKSMYI